MPAADWPVQQSVEQDRDGVGGAGAKAGFRRPRQDSTCCIQGAGATREEVRVVGNEWCRF